MKIISLKIDEDVFQDTENVLEQLKKPRNRYINEALEYYNRIQKRKFLAKSLKEESAMVAAESMKVLNEFENIDAYED
jgi:hypothetical protein